MVMATLSCSFGLFVRPVSFGLFVRPSGPCLPAVRAAQVDLISYQFN